MTRAILKKDLVSLWTSPIPWAVGIVVHLILGLMYASELLARRQALIQPLFPLAGFLLVVAVPIVAMRSFAEEARSGTLDLLQAVPVASGPLVAGKWLATWMTTLGIFAPSAAAVVVLVLYGDPDPGPILAGYLGMALMAASLAAIGVLSSSLTSSQPVAAVMAFFGSMILWFAHVGSQRIATGPLLAHFSISERLRSFASGVIDTADVGFLLLLSFAALAVAATAVDARRLR